MEETITLIDNLYLVILTLGLCIMLYHLYRKIKEVFKDEYYAELTQYNILKVIIGSCVSIVIINIIQNEWIFVLIWTFNGSVWVYNLKQTKENFDNMRKIHLRQQDLFNERPSGFTRKEKSTSDRLDEMLNEDENGQ